MADVYIKDVAAVVAVGTDKIPAGREGGTSAIVLTVDGIRAGLEPAITKGTAFNKNFGTGADDVMPGNTTIPSINGLVPETRTINGLPLSADIVIEAAGGFAAHYHFCEDSTGLGTPVWHELEANSDGGAVGQHTATGSTYTAFDRYLTSALNTDIIPAGDWKFNLYCNLNAASKQGQVRATIYRVDATGTIVGTALGVAESAVFTNINIVGIPLSVFTAAQTGWDLTDRIGIVVEGKRGNVAATVTFYHDQAGGYGSNVSTPLTLLHNQMNGLNQGDYQHLTAAEKAAMNPALFLPVAANTRTVTGTTDTILTTDAGKDVRYTSGTAVTLTLPAYTGFSEGFQCTLHNDSASSMDVTLSGTLVASGTKLAKTKSCLLRMVGGSWRASGGLT